MRISVIIPVRDGEAFLGQTIRSALNQSLPPAEILVVDNGSTDRTVEIAASFGKPVQVLHEPAAGACSARNTGAAAATGEALMFLDADDLIGPTVLEELANVLAARPGSVACCPWRRYELTNGCWRVRPASCKPRRPGQDPLSAWLTGWYHPPCSVLWSAEAYRRSGGWDPAIRMDQDGDMMMRALAAGVPLEFTAGGTAYYRRLPDGAISLSGRRLTPEGLRSRLEVIEGVERTLTEHGNASRFRLPLRAAFQNIRTDAAGQAPDVARRADAGARRNKPRLLDYIAEWSARARGLLRLWGRDKAILPPSARPGPPPALPSPSGGQPLVSVIIPTYNRPELTRAAVASVLAQDYAPLEVLVVDDCSTDDTVAMLQSHDDPRLRIIRQPRNQGVAAARNRGIRESRGSLIAFLDSDDEWLPGKLARQVDLVRRRPDSVGFFYTGVVEQWQHGKVTWVPEARGDVLAAMLHRNVVHTSTSSVLIRREVFETVGLFDEDMPANEDHDLWARVATFYQLDFLPEPLVLSNQALGGESGLGRRSRNFMANMQARAVFLDHFGTEAQRLGTKYLYHLDCARRHIESPYGRIGPARVHLLKAIASNPGQPRLYLWLLFSLVPKKLRDGLAPGLKSLRVRIPARLWFGHRQPL